MFEYVNLDGAININWAHFVNLHLSFIDFNFILFKQHVLITLLSSLTK